jgi:hypothetical protein
MLSTRFPASMKMMSTSATTPDAYAEALSGWQRAYVVALRTAVRSAAPALREQLKWGHLVYLLNGPVLLLRAEPERVLFGFWRGGAGASSAAEARRQAEMATLALRPRYTASPRDRVVVAGGHD